MSELGDLSRPPFNRLPPDLTGAALAFAVVPVLAAAVWWAEGTMAPVIGALALWVLCGGAISAGVRHSHPHARFGPANGVTTLRAAGVVWLCATLPVAEMREFPEYILFLLSLALILLDGVDGYLARRTGQASAFGARFDMEVDSALALVLALHIWLGGAVGPWILILGLIRYAFIAASFFDPALARPLPVSMARKVVCVQQLATLCLLSLPGLPGVLYPVLAGASAATLLWSFGRDIAWLKARRGS